MAITLEWFIKWLVVFVVFIIIFGIPTYIIYIFNQRQNRLLKANSLEGKVEELERRVKELENKDR
ncbi:MAG: hypothetical protein ACK4M9_05635 [Anaerobacillus sp.]|uniref:hypothetical protein n=1 Tax=Anaerobacillus sp. TaxID=1872506 RepID=UPI003919BCFB